MRSVVQRVSEATVAIDGKEKSRIGKGALILLGVELTDTHEDADWLVGKISRMRIFPDENKVMNLSLLDCKGEAIVVSQFTLHASTKKGNRPSYIKAARPEHAIPLYEYFIAQLQLKMGMPIGSGEFGADMQVSLTNDGPVTIIVDSKKRE